MRSLTWTVQTIALFQWYINLAGLNIHRDVQFSTNNPGASHMEVSQQYLVKTKFYDSGKDAGSPQDY